MSKIIENLHNIKREISSTNIKILAVTKYVGVKEVMEAYKAGLVNFAENKVKDAEEKRSKIPDEIQKNMIWHFIGHLQTNKVKKVVGNFEYIHSVDSIKLAKLISDEAKAKNLSQKVLIQVNIANEESKFGFGVEEVKEVFTDLISLDSLDIVGLMTMAPHTVDEQILHSVFKELRELRNYLQIQFSHPLPELSMGMSNDYKIAIEEGSTMIRLGQALFK